MLTEHGRANRSRQSFLVVNLPVQLVDHNQTFFAVYVSYDYRDAFGLLILILVLIFRPQGILGERSRDV